MRSPAARCYCNSPRAGASLIAWNGALRCRVKRSSTGFRRCSTQAVEQRRASGANPRQVHLKHQSENANKQAGYSAPH
jgi:hypothetical protein